MPNFIGNSRGAQLDRMVEIVGDDLGHHHHHRRHHHRRFYGQPGQPGQFGQPGQPVQPGQPGYQNNQAYYPYQAYDQNAAPPPPPIVSPPVMPPPGPQPTIDVFVGACLNKGVKSARITSYLKGIGYSNKQISRAFDRNLR